jgi:hypothetical protein
MIRVTNAANNLATTKFLKVSFDVPDKSILGIVAHPAVANNSPALSQRLRNDQWRNDHLWQHKARGGHIH